MWCWFWTAVSSRKSLTPSSGCSTSRVWCRCALYLGLLWFFWVTSSAITTGSVLTLRGTAGLWTCSFLCTTVLGSMIKTSSNGHLELPRKFLFLKTNFCFIFYEVYFCNILLTSDFIVFIECRLKSVSLIVIMCFFFLYRYRHFPVVTLSGQMVKTARPYLCNFLGTMYKNSSRETLMAVLKQNGLEKDCLMHVREKYVFLEVLSIIFSAWF